MFQVLEEHLIVFVFSVLAWYGVIKINDAKPIKQIYIDKKAYEECYNLVLCMFVVIIAVFAGYICLTWIKNERGLICFMSKSFLDTAPLLIEILLSGILTFALFFLGNFKGLTNRPYHTKRQTHHKRPIRNAGQKPR